MKAFASLITTAATAALAVSIAPVSQAQTAVEPASLATLAITVDLTVGEVQKVDAASSRITIKHGTIRNLNLAASTMAFAVADPALLEGVQAGERVKFLAIRTDDGIVVTEIRRNN